MNVGLVDIDSHNFPNLVLMKLSAWHKRKGDKTFLLRPTDILRGQNLFQPYDKIYGACVFSENAKTAYQLEKMGVYVAGSGTGKKENLPDEIEHIMPDYALYGICDTAYGFLTRGCPRCCPFCIVSEKEGKQSIKVADLHEWWAGQKYIELLDPNLLACKEHIALLKQLADSSAEVNFSQGLDARLLNDKNIAVLNTIRIKMLHFAWDNPRDKSVPDALEKYAKKGSVTNFRRRKVYILVNYWSTFEEDLKRVYWLRDRGYDPYVMIYDKLHTTRKIRRLQRWVNNKRIFNTVKNFEGYR